MNSLSQLRGLLICCLVTAVAAFAPSVSRGQPLPSAALDDVSTKAAQLGKVRVIVGLNQPFRAEGSVGPSEVASQRSATRAAQKAVADLVTGTQSRMHRQFEAVPFVAMEVDPNGLARLKASPLVRDIQEDRLAAPTLLQSAPLVNATSQWTAGITGSDWAVAVLDTGVDKTHPFLAGKVVSEACYSSTVAGQSTTLCPGGVESSTAAGSGVNCSTSLASGCSHGTHVAGIVAGTGAADGSAGVAKGAKIIAVQVYSYFPAFADVMTWESDYVAGLERVYALRSTYSIAAVNMSLGGGRYFSNCDATHGATKAAIDNLRSVGIATVIASGNDGYRDSISSPACVSAAISVGSTCDLANSSACATGLNGVASYSNIAGFVSLLAPGSLITSSVPGGGYASKNGTSMAAPHVAGAWALIKQASPAISVTDALAHFRATGLTTNDTRSGGSVSGLKRIDLESLPGSSYSLTVSRVGTGSGTVTSSPAGISCGATCSASFPSGTPVTLTAVAASGSTFVGWSGACTGTGSCVTTMSAARSVTATFNSASAGSYTLSVTKAGSGIGTVSSSPAGINCGFFCSASFASGTNVTLTPVAVYGSTFAGWSGACTGTGSCVTTMSAARSVTATFNKAAAGSYTLSVGKAGTGSGTVTSGPAGIDCGLTCSANYSEGTSVTLTAVAASGSTFAGWSGACTGTGSCVTTMSAARSVTATFNSASAGSYTLSVTKAGSGSGAVTSSPAGINCGLTCSADYSEGTSVTLTALAAFGSTFAGWSGACTGTRGCVTTMSAARSVTATFVRLITIGDAADSPNLQTLN